MDATTKESVVLQILDTCRLIQAATSNANSSPRPAPRHPHPILQSLSLPPHPDITAELKNMGLPAAMISNLSDVFHSTCDKLNALHYREFSKLLSTVGMDRLRGKLTDYFCNSYTQKVNSLRLQLIRRAQLRCDVDTTKTAKASSSRPTKTVFNYTLAAYERLLCQDYVPVLEKYFEYNAYPSAADRALMARKSMMTERQIEVWFQNHRNRARKDGKPLARLRASDLLPADVSFDSLDATMGDLIRTESERLMMERQEDEEDDSDGIEALALSLNVTSSSRASSVDSERGTPTASQPAPMQDALNPSTPPFAYPAPYVPRLYTFLGAASRPPAFTFSQPKWARQASTTHSNSTAKLSRRDIEAFADLFARLNVREGAQKQGRHRIAPLPQSRNSPAPQQRYTNPAATCAITTILCPGRHPAFVPFVAPRATCKARKSPSPPPPYEFWMSSPGAGPSKSATSTSAAAFTFQSPPQYSQSAAPTSSPVNASAKASTPTPRRRKSPQLPRRVPGSPPVARPYSQTQNQTTSHPTPQRSPRPSHHPYTSPSRASSSASSSSSHRVSSSSSSSASSSTPTTPNGSTMSLPTSYSINTPKNAKPTSPVFTAQNIVDIFDDAAAFTTPSSQGFSGFGTAGFDSLDFARMPMGNMFDFNFNTSHGPSIVQARS
uniref:Homeodomain 2 mating type protein n=1 Tax=Pleurotus tuoliensis TaxID=879823 RepID=G8DA06_9AGAR|nr:homeodomain 2 mating type protein [Pleurotus tuoliensis]